MCFRASGSIQDNPRPDLCLSPGCKDPFPRMFPGAGAKLTLPSFYYTCGHRCPFSRPGGSDLRPGWVLFTGRCQVHIHLKHQRVRMEAELGAEPLGPAPPLLNRECRAQPRGAPAPGRAPGRGASSPASACLPLAPSQGLLCPSRSLPLRTWLKGSPLCPPRVPGSSALCSALV